MKKQTRYKRKRVRGGAKTLKNQKITFTLFVGDDGLYLHEPKVESLRFSSVKSQQIGTKLTKDSLNAGIQTALKKIKVEYNINDFNEVYKNSSIKTPAANGTAPAVVPAAANNGTGNGPADINNSTVGNDPNADAADANNGTVGPAPDAANNGTGNGPADTNNGTAPAPADSAAVGANGTPDAATVGANTGVPDPANYPFIGPENKPKPPSKFVGIGNNISKNVSNAFNALSVFKSKKPTQITQNTTI